MSNRVVSRNGLGQLIRDCEQAGEDTAREAVERGAKLSRAMAPVGTKPDSRTKKLKDSIETHMISATSGVWYSTARHALPVEFSAAPHDISGKVFFFWEKEGRMWQPGENIIDHPGNPAQPFLRPAYDIVMAQIMEIARREYP